MSEKWGKRDKGEVIVTTIYCGDGCPLFDDPAFLLEYPNTDNEKAGWRCCKGGSVVKRNTGACHQHPRKESGRQEHLPTEVAEKEYKLVPTKLAQACKKEPVQAPVPELAGGLDFAARLRADIEAMARRARA